MIGRKLLKLFQGPTLNQGLGGILFVSLVEKSLGVWSSSQLSWVGMLWWVFKIVLVHVTS